MDWRMENEISGGVGVGEILEIEKVDVGMDTWP
jgi:hypothetical protein